MKPISGKVNSHLAYPLKRSSVYDFEAVAGSPGSEIRTFRQLQGVVAYLGYYNPGYDVLLRGQNVDYMTSARISALVPSIHRHPSSLPRVTPEELRSRLDVLERTEDVLVKAATADRKLQGRSSLLNHREARWALLQHYRCCTTPLLDVTRSTRVAASFIVPPRGTNPGGGDRYVYVFGMPYQTGNITHNFVDNMQILNLRNVLGHNALRPHEQEGYLVGSLLGWDKPGRSNNLAVRLLGKVRILLAGMTDTADFWGDYDSIPNHILLPPASDDPYRRWLERNGLQPDSV